MGVQGFFKWLCQKFPECIIHDKNVYSHCQTLFIDICQIRYKSFAFIEQKMKEMSPKEQIQKIVIDIKKRVKRVILSINPHEQILIFHDGPCPAIKFQKQRERCFKFEHIDNYVIDPTEYKLSDINADTNEFVNDGLIEFIQEITNNCKYLRAKQIFYSSSYAPGEAEHKYFEFFRNQKKSSKWRFNQLHSIYSTDNDLILLALQFIDEHFLVIRDENTVVDISILRDLLLFQLFQKDTTFSINNDQNTNRVERARNISARIPSALKQQVVNDIIALSFIIGNDFLPPIPNQNSGLLFTNLLNAYKKINQEFFTSVISNERNKSMSVAFMPLIVNDTFCVSSLQKIVSECFNKPMTSLNMKDDTSNNMKDDTSNNMKDDTSNNMKDDTSNNTKDDTSNNMKDDTSNNMKNDDNESNEELNDDLSNSQELQKHTDDKKDCDLESSQICSHSDFTHLNQQQAQHMLRVFNFTWLYYSRGCPSWTYYFPFKNSLPLHEAVELMVDETPSVFATPGSLEKTEQMFNTFVVFPVDSKQDLPWCLYRLKIPPSEIAHFWPLGATKVDDIPMVDLDVMKKFYDEAKKLVIHDELKYNRSDDMYHMFNNQNKREKYRTSNKKYTRH